MNETSRKTLSVEELYVEMHGVCPSPEKNIPLHSHSQMILFASAYASPWIQEQERLKAKIHAMVDCTKMAFDLDEKVKSLESQLSEAKRKQQAYHGAYVGACERLEQREDKLVEALEKARGMTTNYNSVPDNYNQIHSVCQDAITEYNKSKGE